MSQQVSKRVEVLQTAPAASDLALSREPITNPVAAYLAQLSPGSRAGQFSALACALAISRGDRLGDLPRDQAEVYRAEVWATNWAALRPEHMSAIRSALADAYAAASANKVLAAIKGVLKSAWTLRLIETDDYMRTVEVKSIRGQALPTGRDIAYQETALLMRACDDDESITGVRDAAMIGVGWHVGLRIAEAASLDLADYEPESGRLVIRKGKGSKAREVYITNESAEALADWIAVRGSEPGPLFCPVNRRGEIEMPHMSTWAIQKRLKRRADQAGIEPVTWHDLRRTAIGDVIESDGLASAQKLAGHANTTTTSRYSRRDAKLVKKAMSSRHLPYKSRRNGRA